MSDVWTAVLLVGAGTIVLKSSGPVLLGGRAVPGTVARILDMLAPAVLAALVVTQLVAGDRALVLDERLGGIAAAGVAIALRAPILVTVVVAAVVTALLRLVL
jgi:branched-subunit amino acid transport protein